VEKLTLEEFRNLFRQHKDAFHLEIKDAYGVEQEDEPFRRFLAGEPQDYSYRAGYLGLIREVTDAGATVRRVRIVTEPLNDYARFLAHITPDNVAAGEAVRYMPRHRVTFDLPAEDCWLFDRELLVLVVFHETGRMDGFYVADDPELVRIYRSVTQKVWDIAVPFAEYVNSQ
jgi:hypothetical protein